MSQQTLNYGAFDNDPSAESLRSAFTKCQSNFSELYGSLGGANTNSIAAFNVLNYGTGVGTGNATTDTAAITAAAAAAGASNVNAVVYFPGGKDYRLNSTIAWPNGVHMIGGNGASGNRSRPPQIRWNGTAGGTMFTCVNTGDRVQNMLVYQIYFREGTTEPATAMQLGTATEGIDFGTEFTRCWFANLSGDVLKYMMGPTNLHINKCRWDNCNGFSVYIKVNNQTIFSMKDITIDMVGGSQGFVHMDGTGAGNNKMINASFEDLRLEVNAQPLGEKALFLCTIDPTASQKIMHLISGHNIWTPAGAGITDYCVFKPVLAGQSGVTTNAIIIDVQMLNYSSGRIMDNTTTAVAATNAGWPILPRFSFCPTGRNAGGLSVTASAV